MNDGVHHVHIQIAWRQLSCWADPRHVILLMNCILLIVFFGLHIDAKFKYGYSRATIPDTTWRLFLSYQLNAHFLYSITIYMLHYNPQHVSSSILLIFRRRNCIITASGIVTLCKQPYSMPVESGLQSALNRHTVRPIPEAVIIQFILLKMSKVLLETCWGI